MIQEDERKDIMQNVYRDIQADERIAKQAQTILTSRVPLQPTQEDTENATFNVEKTRKDNLKTLERISYIFNTIINSLQISITSIVHLTQQIIILQKQLGIFPILSLYKFFKQQNRMKFVKYFRMLFYIKSSSHNSLEQVWESVSKEYDHGNLYELYQGTIRWYVSYIYMHMYMINNYIIIFLIQAISIIHKSLYDRYYQSVLVSVDTKEKNYKKK